MSTAHSQVPLGTLIVSVYLVHVNSTRKCEFLLQPFTLSQVFQKTLVERAKEA